MHLLVKSLLSAGIFVFFGYGTYKTVYINGKEIKVQTPLPKEERKEANTEEKGDQASVETTVIDVDVSKKSKEGQEQQESSGSTPKSEPRPTSTTIQPSQSQANRNQEKQEDASVNGGVSLEDNSAPTPSGSAM